MYVIYRGLRQRNLDQEISRRESLEYLLDRDTFDSYDLEARAPLWPKKQPVVPTWPNLNTDRPTPQATFTMPVPLPRSPPKSGSPSPAANSHDPHHLD